MLASPSRHPVVHPVVCQLETGQLRFDNFGGLWGEQAQLDRFLQAYACPVGCRLRLARVLDQSPEFLRSCDGRVCIARAGGSQDTN
jgi:hypothetical protein